MMKKHENYELCKKWCAPPAVLGRVPPRRGHSGGAHRWPPAAGSLSFLIVFMNFIWYNTLLQSKNHQKTMKKL